MDTLPILQSGFVSVGKLQVIKPDPFIDTAPRTPLFQQPDQRYTEAFYSPEISKMYFEMVSDKKSLSDFGFREKIIELAFASFGVDHFGDWIEKQKSLGHVEVSHLDFLADTLRFTAGFERRIHTGVWLSMISRSSTKMTITSLDLFKGLDSDQKAIVSAQNTYLPEMVYRWVNQQNGYQDLLSFLMVVYGTRNPKHGPYVE